MRCSDSRVRSTTIRQLPNSLAYDGAPGHAQRVRSGCRRARRCGTPCSLPLRASVASGRYQVVVEAKPGVDDGEDGDDHNKAEEDAGPQESAPSFPAASHAGTAFPVAVGS